MKKVLLFGSLLLASLSHCFALIEIGIYAPGTYGTNPDGATFEIAISPQDLYPAVPAAAEFNLIIYAPTADLTGSETFDVFENQINGGVMQWDQSQTYAHTDGNTYYTFTYSGTGIDLSVYGEDQFVLALSIGVNNASNGVNWGIADENTTLFDDFSIRSSLNLLGDNQLVSVATPAILPLKLLSFTVTASSSERIDLAWDTAEENDMSHFELERSYDGRTFSVIRKENAQNTQRASYRFIDDMFRPSLVIYYRLKMVEADDSFEYSSPRAVTFDDIKTIEVYPNPATTEFTIVAPEEVTVTVTGISGEVILKQAITSSTTQIGCAAWPSGVYALTFRDDAGKVIHENRFVKQ